MSILYIYICLRILRCRLQKTHIRSFACTLFIPTHTHTHTHTHASQEHHKKNLSIHQRVTILFVVLSLYKNQTGKNGQLIGKKRGPSSKRILITNKLLNSFFCDSQSIVSCIYICSKEAVCIGVVFKFFVLRGCYSPCPQGIGGLASSTVSALSYCFMDLRTVLLNKKCPRQIFNKEEASSLSVSQVFFEMAPVNSIV